MSWLLVVSCWLLEKENKINMTEKESKRYARQISLPQFGKTGQEKLLSSSVLVIGAGGLGCPALLYLAGAGIGKIGAIDHDNVSLSNLHRQTIYSVDHIGRNKAESAGEVLSALNPDIQLSVYPFALTSENAWDIFSEFDVIIDGTDHFSTRYMINDLSVLQNKPLVFAAVSGFEGQLSVFNYNSTIHYRDLFPNPPQEELIPNCEEAGVLGAVPGIIGTMQALEAIKIISGIGKTCSGQLFTYNGLTNETYSFDIPKSDIADSLIPKDRKAFEKRDYILECADPSKARFNIDLDFFDQWKDRDDVIIIDVREFGEQPEVDEFNHAKIPMSVFRDEMKGIKENNVIIFCQVGQRSLIAARTLSSYFGNTKKVYSLSGGIVNWKNSRVYERK